MIDCDESSPVNSHANYQAIVKGRTRDSFPHSDVRV
jgi:hypothetical protein